MDKLMSKFKSNNENEKVDSEDFNQKLFTTDSSISKSRPEPLKMLSFQQRFKGGGSNRKISLNSTDRTDRTLPLDGSNNSFNEGRIGPFFNRSNSSFNGVSSPQ